MSAQSAAEDVLLQFKIEPACEPHTLANLVRVIEQHQSAELASLRTAGDALAGALHEMITEMESGDAVSSDTWFAARAAHDEWRDLKPAKEAE